MSVVQNDWCRLFELGHVLQQQQKQQSINMPRFKQSIAPMILYRGDGGYNAGHGLHFNVGALLCSAPPGRSYGCGGKLDGGCCAQVAL